MALTDWGQQAVYRVASLLETWPHAVVTNGPDWGPWGMHMMWGSWGLGMMFMMFLFWAAMLVGIVLLIRWLVTVSRPGRQPASNSRAESPLDILKKRYARGEITKQEFEEIRQDLHTD